MHNPHKIYFADIFVPVYLKTTPPINRVRKNGRLVFKVLFFLILDEGVCKSSQMFQLVILVILSFKIPSVM